MDSVLDISECIKATRNICRKHKIHIPHYYNLIGNPYNLSFNKEPHPETGEITYCNSNNRRNLYKNSKLLMATRKTATKKLKNNNGEAIILDNPKYNIGIAKSKNSLFKEVGNKHRFLCPQCPEEKPLQYSIRSLICFKHKFKLAESGLQKLTEYLSADQTYHYPVCKECLGTTIGVTMNHEKPNFGLIYYSCICEKPMIIILDNSVAEDNQLSLVFKDMPFPEYKALCNEKDEKIAKEKELRNLAKSKILFDKNRAIQDDEQSIADITDYDFVL